MIKVGKIVLDMATTIRPTFKSRATSHPIERSSPAADHVIDEPTMLSLDCVVSNHPVGEMVAIRESEGGVPSIAVLSALLALRAAKTPVAVVTASRAYFDMVLLEVTPAFDSRTHASLRVSLMLQALNLVSNDRVFVQPAIPLAGKRTIRGHKAGKTPPDKPPAATEEDVAPMRRILGDP